MRPTQEEIERFWSKVDKKGENECWLWTGGQKNKEGYGGFWLNELGNTVNCHKLMFIIVHNFDWDDIPDGIVIRHTCNNYYCINPKHLKLGTYKDNSQDMIDAGNSMKGKENPKKRKLTIEIANELRELWKTGNYTYVGICSMYGISTDTLHRILANISYRNENYKRVTFKHVNNKLSKENVQEIRKLREEGMSVKEIISRFDIGQTQFYNIINRKQWVDV